MRSIVFMAVLAMLASIAQAQAIGPCSSDDIRTYRSFRSAQNERRSWMGEKANCYGTIPHLRPQSFDERLENFDAESSVESCLNNKVWWANRAFADASRAWAGISPACREYISK